MGDAQRVPTTSIALGAQILDSNTIEAKLALAEIYDQVPVAVR